MHEPTLNQETSQPMDMAAEVPGPSLRDLESALDYALGRIAFLNQERRYAALWRLLSEKVLPLVSQLTLAHERL